MFSLMDMGRQGRAVLTAGGLCSAPVEAGTADASSMAIIQMSLVDEQSEVMAFGLAVYLRSCWSGMIRIRN